ncbi:MAG: sigma factor [Owenweeksia sp.]|nr:sigma factor [Owenweeksia sp.]
MKNNGQITPDNLTEEFCKGNEAALEYLYDAYSGALYGVILKIIPDQELSRDLLQECLIKIWHKRAQYNGDRGTLYTWMLNSAETTA